MRRTFKDIYRDAMDYVLLNLIFLVVVALGAGITFGAAFKAMFHVGEKINYGKDRVYVWKDFFRAFKEGFWQSTLSWLVLAMLGLLLYFIGNYAYNLMNVIVLASVVATGVFTLTYLLYLYPFLALFETESFGYLLRNVLIIMGRNPFISFKMLGSVAFATLLLFLFSGTILVTPAIVVWLNLMHLRKLIGSIRSDLMGNEEESE